MTEELKTLKEKLKKVKGSTTEVYSRIVGYFRPVENWNEGKRDEYDRRKEYKAQ